jgi:hypothetical protein
MSIKKYKNQTIKGAKVRKMNDETYALRRRAIDIIYELKAELRAIDKDLPRIEVRIVDTDPSVTACAYAYLGQNIVHISTKWAKHGTAAEFYHIVLHEIVHAVTGFRHDNDCYLMHPHLPHNPKPEKSLAAFVKYF